MTPCPVRQPVTADADVAPGTWSAAARDERHVRAPESRLPVPCDVECCQVGSSSHGARLATAIVLVGLLVDTNRSRTGPRSGRVVDDRHWVVVGQGHHSGYVVTVQCHSYCCTAVCCGVYGARSSGLSYMSGPVASGPGDGRHGCRIPRRSAHHHSQYVAPVIKKSVAAGQWLWWPQWGRSRQGLHHSSDTAMQRHRFVRGPLCPSGMSDCIPLPVTGTP